MYIFTHSFSAHTIDFVAVGFVTIAFKLSFSPLCCCAQERSLLQAQEVLELLQHHSGTGTGGNRMEVDGGVSRLPETLARFTAQWTGAHCVALSHVQVSFYSYT